MSEPLVMATAGPFELLAQCEYEKHNTFCEKIATGQGHGGYNLCDACRTSIGLSNLVWEKFQYEAAHQPHITDTFIREALVRIGKELVMKIGRSDLWNEYVENR